MVKPLLAFWFPHYGKYLNHKTSHNQNRRNSDTGSAVNFVVVKLCWVGAFAAGH